MATISDFNTLISNPNDMADFILDLIGEDYNGAVGFRGLYANEKAGKLRKSSEWVDGVKTSKKLSGTCTLGVAANWNYESYSVIKNNIASYAAKASAYGDGRIALVIGDEGQAGEDAGELIIPNAKTIYVWEG
jgi:hypothetical protein